jgi:hypothetical protein
MKIVPWSLAITGVGYLAFGAVLLIRPELLRMAAIEATGPEGFVELRAFYGGVELGLGIFFLIALARQPWWRPALYVQVYSLGGIASARMLALALTPSHNPIVFISLAIELTGTVLGLVALRSMPRGGASAL